MNANYSEALEQQIRLHRWITSSASRGFRDEVYGDDQAWLHVSHEMLGASEPYFVGKDTGHLIANAAGRLPEVCAPIDLMPSSRPCFIWFDDPIELVGFSEVPMHLRAISIGVALMPRHGSHMGGWESHPLPISEPVELFITPWVATNRGGRPVPWAFIEWREGETQSVAVDREFAEAKDAGRVSDRPYVKTVLELASSFLFFIEQRILASPAHSLDRHARRRVEREQWHADPVVRVVQLRRRERLNDVQTDAGGQEWSCQWIVRGHWRQQFYPSKHANQPIWITPYVKGPEDKPLKAPRTTVFAVVR